MRAVIKNLSALILMIAHFPGRNVIGTVSRRILKHVSSKHVSVAVGAQY